MGSSREELAALAEEDKGKNVGIPSNDHTVVHQNQNHHAILLPSSTFTTSHSPVSIGIGRAGFPSMWPFGATSPKLPGSHFRGSSDDANEDDVQSDDSDDSDGGYGHAVKERREGDEEFGKGAGKRRLSVTTEAKRRTSLEDDDEDEVVHVSMAREDIEEGNAHRGNSHADDDELVEIQHAEMQGVEGGK